MREVYIGMPWWPKYYSYEIKLHLSHFIWIIIFGLISCFKSGILENTSISYIVYYQYSRFLFIMNFFSQHNVNNNILSINEIFQILFKKLRM